MTFRIYGETGARCLESGWYVCRLHPEVEEYFTQGEQFSAALGRDNAEKCTTPPMLVRGE